MQVPLPHATLSSIQRELSECISNFIVGQGGASSSSTSAEEVANHSQLQMNPAIFDVVASEQSLSIPEGVEFPRAVSDTVFEATEEYVFKLMERHSFVRFKQRFPRMLRLDTAEPTTREGVTPVVAPLPSPV